MTQSWGRAATRRALTPALRLLDRRIERLARNRARDVVRDGVHADVLDLRNQILDLRAQIDTLRPGQFAVDLLLGPQGRRNSRLVPESGLDELARQIHRISGSPDAHDRVAQAYRLMFELELRGVGRLAGAARNVLGKLATTPLLDPPNGEVLEVGTLFGLFSAGMARQINRIGLECRLTIVDPLAEVQLQSVGLKPDTSGSPVTESVVRTNLSLAGVDPDRFRLVRGLSGDPLVQAAITDRAYGVMIIDGDHSAGGVATDLLLAERVLAPGGIVVVDDYGDRNWPGVEQATDAHLAGLAGLGGPTRFDLLGVVCTSAFLRAR